MAVALGVWRSAGKLTAAMTLVAAMSGAAGVKSGVAHAPRLDPVIIDRSTPVNSFVTDDALGVALDGMEKGEVDTTLTPFNIEKMRSAGLKRVTYRTRPELGIEVWHWTEEGAWSDAAHAQGYWIGADNPSQDGKVTWGYSLPRRGDTIDNANNLGWSRIDDGDPTTFWKSNPYLDPHYTGLSEQRPEWIVFSFENLARFDAARICGRRPSRVASSSNTGTVPTASRRASRPPTIRGAGARSPTASSRSLVIPPTPPPASPTTRSPHTSCASS